jgi:ATP-dependent Clp protease ATP-binding subunit ClpB
MFNPLSKANIRGIVDIQARGLKKLLSNRGMTVELTEKAKDLLGDLGYDPVYGARPLKRAILRFVKDPLSGHILQGDFGQGDHVVVDADGENLVFGRGERPEEVAEA